MEVTGIDENQLAQMIADKLVDQIAPVVVDIMKDRRQDDEFLTKKQVYTECLHCHYQTFEDYYLRQPGFPIDYKGNRMVFSRRKLNHWMSENPDQRRQEKWTH